MDIGKPMTDTVNERVFSGIIKGSSMTEELRSDMQIETWELWTILWDLFDKTA